MFCQPNRNLLDRLRPSSGTNWTSVVHQPTTPEPEEEADDDEDEDDDGGAVNHGRRSGLVHRVIVDRRTNDNDDDDLKMTMLMLTTKMMLELSLSVERVAHSTERSSDVTASLITFVFTARTVEDAVADVRTRNAAHAVRTSMESAVVRTNVRTAHLVRSLVSAEPDKANNYNRHKFINFLL